jgi:hypothetical protein
MDQSEQNAPLKENPGGISRQKRWLYLAFTIIILIALGFGAYFYLVKAGENSNQSADNKSQGIPGSNNSAKTVNYSVIINKTVGDTDRDGLSDEEEKKLGTDFNKADTDGDGLSDYEEVNVYKTDPLKADTDGDGHADGAEVSSGYDPNGPGKLLNINEAIKNLNTNN